MAASRPIVLAAEAADDWVQAAGCGITAPAGRSRGAGGGHPRHAGHARSGAEPARANGRAFVEREHAYAVLARRYLPILTGEG